MARVVSMARLVRVIRVVMGVNCAKVLMTNWSLGVWSCEVCCGLVWSGLEQSSQLDCENLFLRYELKNRLRSVRSGVQM